MAWNTYKDSCPECGAEVLRHVSRRYDFCRGDCNILLFIPSYCETEKTRVHLAQTEEGGRWHKITRGEYWSLIERIKPFCLQKEVVMASVKEKVGHCPGCGEEIRRVLSRGLGLDEWRNCGFCGKKISIPGDPTKKIKLVLVREGEKVKIPKHMLSLVA